MLLLASTLALAFASIGPDPARYMIECKIWSISLNSTTKFGDKQISSVGRDGTVAVITGDKRVADLVGSLGRDSSASALGAPRIRTLQDMAASISASYGVISIVPRPAPGTDPNEIRCTFKWSPTSKADLDQVPATMFRVKSGTQLAFATQTPARELVMVMKVSTDTDTDSKP